MNKLCYLLCLVISGIAVVSCYDDTALWDSLNDHESRIAKLEAQCREMNTNIAALQALVAALEKNDYITTVSPISNSGDVIGYTISFAYGDPITIYHGENGKDGVDGKDGQDGQDGQDGATPVIGVAQDSDGVYCWTLNGEWLLDGNGQKIRAIGQDGKDGQNGEDGQDGADGKPGADGQDGVTPQLKIEDGYWYVSYDNGQTWTNVGQATGDQGPQGETGPQGSAGADGDSMFTDIDYSSSADYVIFTLSNGTQIKVPTWSAFEYLQAQCRQMNTNIEALQSIVSALQNNDYVTDVTPLNEGTEIIGYIISFSKSGDVIIYHGKDGQNGTDGKPGADGQDGQDGVSPVIGVKQDADGLYYWTLNGEWILDDSGNKVRVTGDNGDPGQDGVTPQLKIEDDYWYISYDEGATWTQLDKAVGEDGAPGQDGQGGQSSIFSDVYEENGYVVFILSDGTSYRVPTAATIAAATKLDIHFNVEQGAAIVQETLMRIEYTITGAVGNTLVRTLNLSDGNEVAGTVKPIDNSTGYLYFYFLSWYDGVDDPNRGYDIFPNDITGEDMMNSRLALLVSVTDSEGNNVIKSLNFVEGFLSSVDEVYMTEPAAGSVEARIKTNVAESLYEVVIPETAKSWISYVPTKASVREESLIFNVTANDGDSFRSTSISLMNDIGETFETFTIIQKSENAGESIRFADPLVEQLCISRFDGNLDGVLSYEEAAVVTDVTGLFEYEKQIVSFDEFEHFTSVTKIPDGFLSGCELLESVKLPASVVEIEDNAFRNCTSLKSIILPEGLTNTCKFYLSEGGYHGCGKHAYWFFGCSSLENVTLPSSLDYLPFAAFEECSSLKSITLPQGIFAIPESCFAGCTNLESIISLGKLTHICDGAFHRCVSLKNFDFSSVRFIGYGAFAFSGLTSAIIPEAITRIPDALFQGCSDLDTVIMHDNITHIGEYAFGNEDFYIDNERYNKLYNDNYTLKACSSLKSIVLPANLEYIGIGAFNVSAIEGQSEDGTSAKVLTIPAKVKTIEEYAFSVCHNISGIKMLGTLPPQIDSDTFDEGTPIYVPNNALRTYTNAYADYSYPVLPYDMMDLSLTLEIEVTGEGDYKNIGCDKDNEYWEGAVDFPVSVKLTGDESKLAQVAEYGYYITYYDEDGDKGDTSYFPLESLNVTQTDSLSVLGLYFEANFDTYTATANCQVGAYFRFNDGTVATYDKHIMEFIYDKTPSIELLEVEQVSGIDEELRVLYEIKILTSGSFWIETIGAVVEGLGGVSENEFWVSDGEHSKTLTVYFYEENLQMYFIGFAYGETITSNIITLPLDI